jgi:hypothetical protein
VSADAKCSVTLPASADSAMSRLSTPAPANTFQLIIVAPLFQSGAAVIDQETARLPSPIILAGHD